MASCKLQAWQARNGSTRKMYKYWRMASYSAHSPPNPNPSLLTSSQPNCKHQMSFWIQNHCWGPPQKKLSLVAEFLKHLSRPMISFQSPELSQEGWYCLWMDNISDRLILSTIYIYIYLLKYMQFYICKYILTEYSHRAFVFMRCYCRLSALSQVCHTDCKKLDKLFHRPGHGKRWIKHFGKNWFFWPVPKKSASPCSMCGWWHEILPFHGLPGWWVQTWRALVA